MPELAILSTVALLEEIPDKSLRRGQVGTIVEVLSADVYEVDFSDDSGRTYASVAVSGGRLLPLVHESAFRAA